MDLSVICEKQSLQKIHVVIDKVMYQGNLRIISKERHSYGDSATWNQIPITGSQIASYAPPNLFSDSLRTRRKFLSELPINTRDERRLSLELAELKQPYSEVALVVHRFVESWPSRSFLEPK